MGKIQRGLGILTAAGVLSAGALTLPADATTNPTYGGNGGGYSYGHHDQGNHYGHHKKKCFYKWVWRDGYKDKWGNWHRGHWKKIRICRHHHHGGYGHNNWEPRHSYDPQKGHNWEPKTATYTYEWRDGKWCEKKSD